MKTEKLKITIGVPAYNEEVNIEYLLNKLTSQTQEYYDLDKIIVTSDGSTDRTVEIAKKIANHFQKVTILDDKKRQGKNARLNQLFSIAEGDFLVVIDADMFLPGTHFIDDIAKQLINDKGAGLISIHQTPLRPKNFVGRLLYSTFLMWDYVRLSIPKQDHVQNIYGGVTAYSASFIKNLAIPDGVNEERIFLYQTAKKTDSYRFYFEPHATYWPPATFYDYFKLANRAFGKEQTKLEELFGSEMRTIHIIPRKYKIEGILKSFLHDPFYTLMAIPFGYLLNFMSSRNKPAETAMWDISTSTKKALNGSRTKEKKRVVISCYDDLKNPVYAGGGAVAVDQMADQLKDRYEITIITGKYKGAENKVENGITYIRTGSDLFGHKIGQLIYQLGLLTYTKKLQYDLWIELSTPPFTFSLLPLFVKKTLISWVHMFAAEDMQRKYKLPFGLIETMLAKNYKEVVVLTEYMKNKVKTMNKAATVTVIPNAVELQNTAEMKISEEYFLYLGRVEVDQKGLDLLLSSYKKMTEKNKPKLIIAGGGDSTEINKLKQLIQINGLSSDVELRGRVAGKEKQKLLQGAVAISVASRFETFGLVVLDAFTYAKPVVLFDLPQLSWIPKTASLKVEAFNTTKYAEALNKISNDDTLRHQLGESGYSYIKEHSVEATVSQFKNVVSKYL